jgi:hypothetical protein
VSVVGGRGRELRQLRGAGAHLIAGVAHERDLGNGHGFAARFGDGQRLLERQRPGRHRRAAGCGDAGACATTLRDVSVHAASASTNTTRLARDRRRE